MVIKIEYKQNILNFASVLFLLKLENIKGRINDIGKKPSIIPNKKTSKKSL